MTRLEEQAARWAIRAAQGPLPPELQRELEEWLRADTRHRGAYVRARAHWCDLDRLAALRASTEPEAPSSRATALTRRHWLGAAAATVGVLGGGLSWMLWSSRRLQYVSGLGEVRRIPLADGSTVLLNTGSEIVVELGTRLRSVSLVRGEALFDVAQDHARPFVVSARAVAVRAVGTAFDVRLESGRTDVTVTEGTVELVHAAAARSSAPPRLTVNERAVVLGPSAIDIERIAAAEAERRLAWRDGLVVFDNETLQSAVAEINRYNRRQIVIDDPALGARPIVGQFRTTDLEDFARAAAQALDAQIVVDGERLRLRWRRGAGAERTAPRS